MQWDSCATESNGVTGRNKEVPNGPDGGRTRQLLCNLGLMVTVFPLDLRLWLSSPALTILPCHFSLPQARENSSCKIHGGMRVDWSRFTGGMGEQDKMPSATGGLAEVAAALASADITCSSSATDEQKLKSIAHDTTKLLASKGFPMLDKKSSCVDLMRYMKIVQKRKLSLGSAGNESAGEEQQVDNHARVGAGNAGQHTLKAQTKRAGGLAHLSAADANAATDSAHKGTLPAREWHARCDVGDYRGSSGASCTFGVELGGRS